MTLLRDKISLILAESKRPRADLNLLFREWALELVHKEELTHQNDTWDEIIIYRNKLREELREKIMEDTT